MTEEEARGWIDGRFDVSRETWARLDRYVDILLDEAGRQNLIAESTHAHVWARHIVDSAQLLPIGGTVSTGGWTDLGTGAGLPAVVVAILSEWPVTMIESRRKRIDFLEHIVGELGLSRSTVIGKRTETVEAAQAAVISARAYAPLEKLFASAHHLAGPNTIWVLPKGRNAQIELEVARRSWQAVFHVEPSVTDPDSAIIVARSVKRLRRTSRS